MSKTDKIEICSVYLPTASLDRQVIEAIHEDHKAVMAKVLIEE